MLRQANLLISLLLFLFSRVALAQVPTASFGDDDTPSPAPAPTPTVAPNGVRPVPASEPNQSMSAAASTPGSTPDVAGATMASPSPDPSSVPIAFGTTRPATRGPCSLKPLENAMLAGNDPPEASTVLRVGFARLNVLVGEIGSTVYVVPRRGEPDPRQLEFAAMTCETRCVADLPLGSYTVWVKNAEGTESHVDLELRSSRWISAAPANQLMRDFGFAAGVVGAVATVMGVALLGEIICDSCSSTGRNITGALALGLGLPMTSVGWSLYIIHRDARIEDTVLSQAALAPLERASKTHRPTGAVLGAQFSF